MNWKSLRLPAAIFALSAFVQAEVPITQVMNIPNTGQQITPLAPRGARFTYLNPGVWSTIPATYRPGCHRQ